jgi:hypothetical protein
MVMPTSGADPPGLTQRPHVCAGVAPHVVEALLAHKQPGVAAVYNRASFRQAKREALAAWHGLLEGIVSDGAACTC